MWCNLRGVQTVLNDPLSSCDGLVFCDAVWCGSDRENSHRQQTGCFELAEQDNEGKMVLK